MPAVAEQVVEIRPQSGPQEEFLSSSADIVVFGGAAGGSKTYSLLLEALRNIDNPGYHGIIFRRTVPQVRAEGGLWTESMLLYSAAGGVPKESLTEWRFPSGATIRFTHMEHEKNRLDWQGSQLSFIGFDELTSFTEQQFWYMLSRARSTSGVTPYIRATCNPDPDSFVAGLVSWWIDEETGFPIPARSGVVRYFIRDNGALVWGDSADELCNMFPDVSPVDVKSFTFIGAKVHDNKILLKKNPEYLGNLKALPLVDRERLLEGNWKIRAVAGNVYRPYEWMGRVERVPSDIVRTLRYWDRAGTAKTAKNDPDWTAGLKLSIDPRGVMYIEHVARFRGDAPTVEKGITNCAAHDGVGVEIFLEQDPGQAGKMEVQYLIGQLAGYSARAVKVVTNKIVRAGPAAAQMEAGFIKIVCPEGSGTHATEWAVVLMDELASFPNGRYKDQADAFAGAVARLIQQARVGPSFRSISF